MLPTKRYKNYHSQDFSPEHHQTRGQAETENPVKRRIRCINRRCLFRNILLQSTSGQPYCPRVTFPLSLDKELGLTSPAHLNVVISQ